jgi:spore coat protein U-like protein
MGNIILLLGSILVVQQAHASMCSLNVVGVNFGSYDVFSPIALDSTGTIDISCDAITAFVVMLSAGSGSYSQRYMMYGTNHLYYNLSQNANMTPIWGNGESGTTYLSMSAKNYTAFVYGRIYARQNVFIGTYTDNISVTLWF